MEIKVNGILKVNSIEELKNVKLSDIFCESELISILEEGNILKLSIDEVIARRMFDGIGLKEV